ncbi:hypothetical protein R52603_01005 [Paraburkholderia saeva]|jgi:hypothetical protein|uniref:Uncharacterized protein n=1 Tax=Paraburkholderia saeva TaxID=2777537 RepID=A0A9N8RXB8_9BURK|nr:hypothetical protein R52603_01005 [Paraburkholderia saeva]CAG4896883.1 hypothetical protein R70241_02266 [Paraburkholderia saeva]CAG4901358.1 hypothetical protein LMG31841_02983 [Paraburkholderia saeva]
MHNWTPGYVAKLFNSFTDTQTCREVVRTDVRLEPGSGHRQLDDPNASNGSTRAVRFRLKRTVGSFKPSWDNAITQTDDNIVVKV